MEFRRPSAASLLDITFFAGFLAFAAAGMDTRLIYHWQAPAFYLTSGFVSEFIKYPGGTIDYLYGLIAQSYTSQIWGPLVLTALVFAITALTRLWCRTQPLLRFIPAVLLVYTLNLYYDHTPLVPALLLALGAGILWRSKGASTWIGITLLPVVYYLGGMALVPFTLLVVGTQVAKREYAKGAASLLAAAAIPAAVEWSRMAYIPSSAKNWFADADTGKVAVWWALYIFYTVMSFVAAKAAPFDARAPRGSAPAEQKPHHTAAWRPILGGVAILACLAAMAVISYRTNARDRRLAAVDYYTTREDWPKVIEASQRLATADFNSLTRYEINLALHEMNRMGDEMFSFPQTGSTIPTFRSELFLPYMIRITDLFLRLGRINDAQHYGNETMILGASDPRVLRLMADLSIVKGQPVAARKFLTVLASEAGSAGWARQRLQELDRDPQLASDQTVQLLRRRMLQNDDVGPVWQNPDRPDADANRMLLDQLEQDPSNRMAFEFLMGNYLLARDLVSARALMPRIKDMTGPAYETPDGKRRTPHHYQEAMAMFSDVRGTPVELDGFVMEQETLSRMALFKRLMNQSPGRDAAMQASREAFHDSYFFYFVFGPGDYR